MCSSIKSEKGYILIELAIVIAVAGFLIASAVPVYRMYTERNALNVTEENLDVLERAFSNYVQMRWRLPCPADPAAAAGTQFGIERVMPCNAAAQARGIVPYRTLGVPEDFAKDGYGNFFTYVVSPDFTADTRLGVAANSVNERLAHLVAEDNYALLPIAQFCAPLVNTGTDINVQQDGASLYVSGGRDATSQPRVSSILGNETPNANVERENAVTGVSMALISHGSNGTGAYLAGGAQQAGPAGVAEQATNAIDNVVAMSSEFSNTGANEYDDIIRFYTQDEIYAISGGGSCEHL